MSSNSIQLRRKSDHLQLCVNKTPIKKVFYTLYYTMPGHNLGINHIHENEIIKAKILEHASIFKVKIRAAASDNVSNGMKPTIQH